MARKSTNCIYDHAHTIQIFIRNGFTESRSININIMDYEERLDIKLRDSSDFVFNYTTHIDLRRFELMRSDQCLDIDFIEFRSNLIDMLHQVLKHEMFLKCEIDGNICKMIFFGKSRIKSIIFLTVDFQMTSQKEIFDEMNTSIIDLQNLNKNLSSQLQLSKSYIQDKDYEIEKIITNNKELERQFMKELQKLNHFFSTKLEECCTLVLNKILKLTQKLLKLFQEVELVKTEALLKSDSSARLLHSMENLRLESIESARLLDELKRENCHLKATQLNNEKIISELNENLHCQGRLLMEIKAKRDELDKDIKKAALIIAQRNTSCDDLAKDLMRANQALVNFNHLLETKNAEIEQLKASLTSQDKIVEDMGQRFRDLCREYDDYKATFNITEQNKLTEELFVMARKVEELEKVNRENAKLNELLTRKLASGDFTRRTCH